MGHFYYEAFCLQVYYFLGFIIDYIGRRVSIIINAVVFTIGAIILSLSPNFAALVSRHVLWCSSLLLASLYIYQFACQTIYEVCRQGIITSVLGEIFLKKTQGIIGKELTKSRLEHERSYLFASKS